MDYLSESWSLLTLYLLTYLGRPGAALVRNGEGHVHAVVRLSLQCGISLSVLSHEAALVRRVLGLICVRLWSSALVWPAEMLKDLQRSQLKLSSTYSRTTRFRCMNFIGVLMTVVQ